jgi:hypothetical protein
MRVSKFGIALGIVFVGGLGLVWTAIPYLPRTGRVTSTVATLAEVFPHRSGAVLVDPFDRLDSGRWEFLGTSERTLAHVAGGMLQVQLAAHRNAAQFKGLVSRNRYDLRGGSWVVWTDFTHFVPGKGEEAKFRVTRDHQNNYLAFEVAGGRLHLTRKYAGLFDERVMAFDPIAYRVWRIRHDATTDSVYWEASPDGRRWTVLHSDARGFSLKAVTAELYAGSFGSIDRPGIVRFLSFNTRGD